MKLNLQPISNVLGVLVIIIGASILACIPVSLYHQSHDAGALFKAGTIAMFFGILAWKYKFKSDAVVTKREGYLIVVLGWMSMAIFGSLPYYFSGVTVGVTDAFFESMSGLTTTGATIFSDIEFVPKGLLFWRSITQWIGGMGIIVLTVALFPLLGIAGIELFVAEAPGPTSDKLHPRIKESAKRLWFIYVGLTASLFVILMLEGMTGYDAINHAMTTMATGGFSTKNTSIAHYTSPLIQYTIILFMIFAGTNYTIIYYTFKGRFQKVISSDEWRMYIIVLLGATAVVTAGILTASSMGVEESFRSGLFTVVSLITTTGFVTLDYSNVSEFVLLICFLLLFVGACAGSTSGGIKLIRHLVFFKNSILEFKRILHPRAMIRIKINKQIVAPRILTHILVFLLIYLISFVIGIIVVTMLGLDFVTAIGAVATSLGNVGPGIGDVGPVDNFAALSDSVKWVLSFLMLMGRLELFTVLVLFTPYFWRAN